jgi:hypothetical protein
VVAAVVRHAGLFERELDEQVEKLPCRAEDERPNTVEGRLPCVCG